MDIVSRAHQSIAKRDAVIASRFLEDVTVKNISYLRTNASQREALGHLITEKLARHPVPALECLVAVNEDTDRAWLQGFENTVADVIVNLILF